MSGVRLIIISLFMLAYMLPALGESPSGVVDEADLIAAAEKLVEKSSVDRESEPKKAETQDILQEEAAPLFVQRKTQKDTGTSLWMRLVISLIILVAVAGILMFAAKKYAKPANEIGSKAKIKIVQQHHIGPKRSLVLIEVAGEYLLLGVTDQNIQLIKSLSLLDDELSGEVPAAFEDAFEEDFVESRVTAPTRYRA